MIYIIFGLIIVIGILFFIIMKQQNEIKEITQYVGGLIKGEYSSRIIQKTKGYFINLIKNLNLLAELLEKKEVSAGEKEALLNALFDMMKEGIIIAKTNGEIVWINRFIEELYEKRIIQKSKSVQESILNREFMEFVNKKPEVNNIDTIELNLSDSGRYFFVLRNFIEVYKLLLYLFVDITDAKNLKRIKSEFIANLSHELRTPLTAIKGYLETIRSENVKDEDKKKFFDIVCANVDRLINIVSDLLVLSDIERPEKKLYIERFDLNKLAQEVIALFVQDAKKKGLYLNFSPVNIPLFTGDRFLLQQLLINLISNGIRFTEKGGVLLKIGYENKSFIISVSDTGVGISSDEIPKIFERFYTINKSRSKVQGGSGLGLSIVRHIVKLHQGEIKVESNLAEGSKFIIILPQKTPNFPS